MELSSTCHRWYGWYVLVAVINHVVNGVDDEPLTMKSNSVTYVHDLSTAAASESLALRHRRQAQPLTREQIREIVDVHNNLRASEGSADMERMTWNNFLASLAVLWAAECKWEHGQPPLGDYPEYNPIGQNLFATTGSRINLTASLLAWYVEKHDYTYETGQCVTDRPCGHYTQVVWSTSRHIGCAIHQCQPLVGSFSKALYLVCNYGPAGNYVGAKPFIKGPVCSECSSGAGWCKDKLCNSECSSPGDDCSCAAVCHNCATLNVDTCRCKCAAGWYGADCTVTCEDKHRHCGASPGWPAYWCDRSYVRQHCLVMCNLCTPSDSDNGSSQHCDPVYGPGAHLAAPTTFDNTATTGTILVMVVVAVCVGQTSSS